MSQDQNEPTLANAEAGDNIVSCCPFCRLPFAENLPLNDKNQCPECSAVFSVRKY